MSETEDGDQWIPVEFDGIPVWIQRASLRGERDGPIAPAEHVTNGELHAGAAFVGESFAHVYGDEIKQFRRKIGTLADLKPRRES